MVLALSCHKGRNIAGIIQEINKKLQMEREIMRCNPVFVDLNA